MKPHNFLIIIGSVAIAIGLVAFWVIPYPSPYHRTTTLFDRMAPALPGDTLDDADPTHCVVDGDEMPGIGGTIDKPDTALVYFCPKDRRTHIKYLHVLPDSILNGK